MAGEAGGAGAALLHLPRVDRAPVGSELLRVAGAAGRRDPPRMHHAVALHGRQDAAVRGSGIADARIAAVALLAIGSVVGGYVGAHIGRRLPPALFRSLIVGFGVTASVMMLL